MDDAYPSGSSASRDAVVDPPPSSPGDSVSDGEAESPWPYLFRAGLNPDTLLDDGPQLHELREGPSVGLCLELDAARQSLGAPRSVLLVWLARLYGAKWPESSTSKATKKRKKETPLASPVRPSIPMYGGDALLRRSPAIELCHALDSITMEIRGKKVRNFQTLNRCNSLQRSPRVKKIPPIDFLRISLSKNTPFMVKIEI